MQGPIRPTNSMTKIFLPIAFPAYWKFMIALVKKFNDFINKLKTFFEGSSTNGMISRRTANRHHNNSSVLDGCPGSGYSHNGNSYIEPPN